MKKYMDITRLKESYADGFEVGDLIYIQEKLDGANFSIKYDEESDTIKAFSRRNELNFKETLRGAWTFAQTIDKELLKETLGNNLILFGEWLVKHTIPYPTDTYSKAYFYDVYDEVEEKYLPQGEVAKIIYKLGLNQVPNFYIGNFQSWDLVNEYIGKTHMGGEYGEGIVLKNMSKLNNPNERLPFYIKIVGKEFYETKENHNSYKLTDLEAMEERNKLKELTSTVVTLPRVRKMINKFIDEGIIAEDWSEKDMGLIARNLGKRIYEDCVKEESDTVKQVGELFGKFANYLSMCHAREILNNK